MRDATAQVGSPPRTSRPGLRRRPLREVLEQSGSEGTARRGSDITHLIGFGILLSAALLIAVGTIGAPKGSGDTDPTVETIRSAAIDSQGHRR